MKNLRATAASILLLLTNAASTQGSAILEMSIPSLKQEYLECERKALVQKADTGEIMYCSVVYEELKRRAFDGDWRRLRQWTLKNSGAV